ncbi:MAG: 50S ribosomal protein L9 [Acidimicrobiia bacterium]
MNVVLRADVENLGKKGDLLTVADGYARNYLVPRGLALQATRGAVKQAEAMRRNREVREARDRAAAEELAGRLTGATLRVRARAGDGGKLFGSVTSVDVAAAVAEHTGIELDRRKVTLDEPIKELGTFELPAKLHADVDVVLQVEVVAE